MPNNPNDRNQPRNPGRDDIVDIPEDIVDIPEDIVDLPEDIVDIPAQPVRQSPAAEDGEEAIPEEDASLYGDETDDVFLRREKRRKKEQREKKKAEKARREAEERAAKARITAELTEDEEDDEPGEAITEEEASLYGDEADDLIIPRKKREKKKPDPDKPDKKALRAQARAEAKAAKQAEKAERKQARRAARQAEADELFSEKKFRRRFSIFEILNRTAKTKEPKKGSILLFNHHISFPVFFVGLLVLALAIVIFVDDHTITVSETTVPIAGLSDSLEGYRVLVISDLNGRRFGEGQATLLNKLKSVDYDIVLMLGDMVGEGGDAEPFLELVDGLGASKVYFIPGDNDPGPTVGTVRDILGTLEDMVLEDWILAAVELGATYVDSPMEIEVGESTVWLSPSTLLNVNASTFLTDQQNQEEQETGGMLSGLASDYASLPITAYRKQIAQQMFDSVQMMRSGDLHISMAHEVPADDVILASQSHLFDDGKYLIAPDVVVGGHYCGGVWRIPLLGAIYAQSSVMPRYGWFPDDARVCGLYSLDDVKVYITRGLSTNGDVLMPFRINNRPELSLLVFQSTSSGSMLD